MNSSSSSDQDTVDRLAEEFVARHRRGEHPDLAEYTDQFPQYADAIRDLFPALMLIEQVKPRGDDQTGTYSGVAAVGAAGRGLERLGDFRILREVGRGGMGVVYEAEQESLGRHVALKVLPGHALLDPGQLGRFRREARAAARLHHTNIVPVFGVGEQDGLHYYVMQFIQGRSLDAVLEELRRLRRSQPDVARGHQAVEDDRPGSSTSAHEVSAAAVARSLLTGQFALHEPVPGAVGSTPTSDGKAPLASAVPLDRIQPSTATAPVLDPKRVGVAVPASGVSNRSATVSLTGDADLSSLSGSHRGYWQGVARVGLQVAGALAFAHGQRVLHRDIKPSNLMLDTHGNVWVADFGLAKASDGEDLTHTGEVVGTPRYLAPERLRRQSDPRGDVYSLGLTLYELLTLRPAFDAADRERLIQQVTLCQPPRPRQLEPGVPRDLETIVLKAIAREPGHRYATAAALGEDLQRYVDNRPIAARRVSGAERAWRWCRRNPMVASLTAAVAALLIVVAVGSTLSAVQFRGVNRTLESNLYFSDIALAHRECLDENPGRAERRLDGCPIYLRGWEWDYLKRQSHTALLTIPAHDDRVFNVVYSPDGKTLATASQDGTARVFDAATGRLIHTLPGHYPDMCSRVTYSTKGHRLATAGRDKTVKVWDASSGLLIRTLHHGDALFSVNFSPDDRRLATASEDGSIKLWDTKTWGEHRSFTGGRHVVFSPDGRRLGSSGDGRVLIWDTAALETGSVVPRILKECSSGRMAFSPDSRSIAVTVGIDVEVLDVETGKPMLPPLRHDIIIVRDVTYSRDGRYLASSPYDPTVKVWDTKKGRLLRAFRGHIDTVNGTAFAPDGRRLASASSDGTVKVWDVTNLEEQAPQEALTLTGQTGFVLGVVHSADGRSFATIDGPHPGPYDPMQMEAVTIWDAKTGRAIRTIHNPMASACHHAAFDPSFERIAWAGSEGTIEIRDATTRDLRLTLKRHTNPVWKVAYSPDGRLLASASRDGTVRVWDAMTGKCRHILSGFRQVIFCLRFSPDSHRLALAGEKSDRLHPAQVKVWDAVTGRPLPTLGGSFENPRNMAFHSLVGRLVASGQELVRLHGHTGIITSMAFSPDGRRLASGGDDGTVKLWDPATRREIITLLHGRGHLVQGVSFSPDGHQIISVSMSAIMNKPSGTIKIWDATPLPE
jgi:WD40 repeat protein/serine/threonine protein kinase